ncbi:MAG: response regulator [Gemmataceae bacterium]|nr:response regulator [Gemmataceae bacterium]
MCQPLILVVDDAPDIGVIVRRFGRQMGHAVVVEPDAESAWVFFQQAKVPNLVILDFNLPGANGSELCQRLRATTALASLPVALFSNWGRPQDIVAGLNAGADYVLSKDLLLQPVEWQQRLAEILAPPAGRFPPKLISWMNSVPFNPRRLAQQFNHTLRGPTVARLEGDVVPVILRRAWHRARKALPGGFVPAPNDTHGWLLPDGTGLDPERVAAQATPESVGGFLTAFAEQIWCLLGSTASAPFWVALTTAPASGDSRRQ